MSNTQVLSQDLIKGQDIPLSLDWRHFVEIDELVYAIVKSIESATPQKPIGLATHLRKDGELDSIAFAVENLIFAFRIDAGKKANPRSSTTSAALADILRGLKGCLVGFGIVRLAMHIRFFTGLDVRGCDLLEVVPPKKKVVSPGHVVRNEIDLGADSFDIDSLWDFSAVDDKSDRSEIERLCLRAWISRLVASHPIWTRALSDCSPIDTGRLSEIHFKSFHRMLLEVDKIDLAKPTSVQNDFSSVIRSKDGNITIKNDRYKTRVRNSEKTKVVFVDTDNKEHFGRAKGSKGKQTYVQPLRSSTFKGIKQVRVMGREELTNSEKARDEFLLRLLQGKRSLADLETPFISRIWFPGTIPVSSTQITNAHVRVGCKGRSLNQSQANVVEAMVCSPARLVIAHGPPGTGKTTTISVAAREWTALCSTVWIVAQSNVGVKNIAESLCKHDVDFKLLVSKEFYEEWHEHLYEGVDRQLIRSDEFPRDLREVELLFSETRVILCTLSTVSNPILFEKRVFELVPMANMVIDEASQIGVFDYLHLFAQFDKLRKICFFGDPNQLPPFGQDAAPSLQSIFDIPHLQSSAYFLNTQYRMPLPLGDFISTAVYSSRLKSEHSVTSRSCLAFVDVCNGDEIKHGKSWKNQREVQSIVHLVRHYYQGKDYCVITPYDAQRNAIQKALQAENLRSDNVFNVDSFQGNEASYVLVSVVRTQAPGFLKSQNRVNVMLTRCKEGMVIVTKRAFVRKNNVNKTLIGKLVYHWESRVGQSVTWRDWRKIAEAKANLPGAPAGLSSSAIRTHPTRHKVESGKLGEKLSRLTIARR